jgi:hypothetical protein
MLFEAAVGTGETTGAARQPVACLGARHLQHVYHLDPNEQHALEDWKVIGSCRSCRSLQQRNVPTCSEPEDGSCFRDAFWAKRFLDLALGPPAKHCKVEGKGLDVAMASQEQTGVQATVGRRKAWRARDANHRR